MSERLPCGVDRGALLELVAGEPPTGAPAGPERGSAPITGVVPDPEHLRTCPHCRAALAELRSLWGPVEELARERVTAPAELLAAVRRRVRELPRQRWHAVIPTDRGEVRIAARVVAAVARLAAEAVPSVTLAVGGGRTAAAMDAAALAGPAGEAATRVGVSGSHVVVDVHVVVEMGAPLAEVGEAVRRAVARRVAEQTGLVASEVNVVVLDVVPAGPTG